MVGDDHFVLDEAKAAEEARYDGLYVLRTNTKLSVFEVAMRYRELWKVERIFRTTKSGFDTRPVYHQSDEAIRGHLFCSFLALVLRAELETRLEAAGAKLEWRDIIADLDRLIETTVEQDGRHFILRNQAPGCAGTVFQAVKVALPPLFRRVQPDGTDPPPRKPAKIVRKRRLTPRRRSATPDSKIEIDSQNR
ncbi:MAG: hypothetical protein WCJ64_26005 [Rhodospirillaceae bacterium]